MEKTKLKIELMINGINVSKEIRALLIKRIGAKFYNDDYVTTSGIMLDIGDDIFVTSKLNQDSKYSLDIIDDKTIIRYGGGY